MSSYRLLSDISEAIRWIKPDDPMISWLYSIAAFGRSLETEFEGVMTSAGNELPSYRLRLGQRLSEAADSIKKFKRRDVFISLTDLENKFRNFESPQENISTALQQFQAAFDEFSGTYSPVDTTRLAFSAMRLTQRINATRSVLESIANSLMPSATSEASISLYFEDVLEWEDIRRRVEAGLSFFASIATLLFGEDAPQASVHNIQSGSLWVLFVLRKDVRAFAVKILSELAGFAHRNLTTEGKIQSLVDRADVLRALNPIREQLKSSNMGTDNFDKYVQRAAERIAEDAATLFGASGSIDIEETKISVGKESILPIGSPVAPKLISDQSDASPPPAS